MTVAEGIAIVAAMTVFTVWVVLFNGPSTLLAVPVPRSWRARYRATRPRGEQRSARIPRWMRRVVFGADLHRCVGCRRRSYQLGPGERLEVDHGLPWIGGGLTCLFNLFTLCSSCNEAKSCWRVEGGRVRGGRYGDRNRGVAIFLRERRVRWNPLRWMRLAWMIVV